MNERIVSLCMAVIIALMLLAGCMVKDNTGKSDGKIAIKIQYEAGRMNLSLESVLEEKFKNVDIITDEIVGEPEYIISKEMEYHLEPDIYLYEDLQEMDDAIISERFYDLSRESFTNNFYLSAISNCVNSDGGLYYLPGPIYVYGIVYDKTAFSELNLSVPHSYSEFAELIQRVREMNLIGEEPDDNDPEKTISVKVEPFVPTIKWPDMWSIIFNTYNYENALRGADNTVWLTEYQNGKGSMVGHMDGAAEKFLKLFEDGIISSDLWEVRAPVRTRKLYKYHTSLMTIECQSAIGFNEGENENDRGKMHEIGMMPFYTSDEKDSDYVYTMPRCYYGMTKKAAENKQKKDAILQIFEYLSTPDGQDLLIEGGGGDINLLKDSVIPNGPFYDEVRNTMNEGRMITNFCYAGKSEAVEIYMHGASPALADGSISTEEWLKEADNVRDEALKENSDDIQNSYGTVANTLTMEETAAVIGDAYIHATGADIGIVPCTANFGMKFRLFEGPITDTVINSIATTRMGAGNTAGDPGHTKLVVISITGKQLLDLLNSYGDNFVAVAGMEVEYAPELPEGERYVSIKFHGEELKPDEIYKAAVVRGAAREMPVEKIFDDLTFSDMFISYIDSIGGTVYGASESLKITRVPWNKIT